MNAGEKLLILPYQEGLIKSGNKRQFEHPQHVTVVRCGLSDQAKYRFCRGTKKGVKKRLRGDAKKDAKAEKGRSKRAERPEGRAEVRSFHCLRG